MVAELEPELPMARPRPKSPSAAREHLAAAAWAMVIAAALWTPAPEAPPEWGWWSWLGELEAAGGDKVVHALLFGVQAWLLCRWRRGAPTGAWLGGCLALTIAYGGMTEAVQAALGGRAAELGDLVADAVGAGIGVAAFAWRRGRVPPLR
jgi:hypothetical protein